jgi:hypothetical protein
MFCPEKGESEAADSMVDLTTRGRKRGFCAVWATQRLANVNKDATSMLLNRLVGGTFEDVDLKRALDLLSVPSEQKHGVAQELKTLEPGQFFAFGRAISKERILVNVGPVQTSHPKPGSSKHAAQPPEASAKIRAMLGALADIPKVAEEKARTTEDFKSRIRELTNQLAAAKKVQPAQPSKADPQELKKLRNQVSLSARRARDLKSALEALMKEASRVADNGIQKIVLSPDDFKPVLDRVSAEIVKIAQKKIDQRNGDFQALTAELRKAMPRLAKLLAQPDVAVEPAAEIARVVVTPRASKSASTNSNGPSVVIDGLNQQQVKILNSLAQFAAIGRASVAKKMVAILTEVSHSSGGFSNNLGGLRSAGYIEYPEKGMIALTSLGRESAPQSDAPTSAEEMLDRCKQVTNTAQGAILDVLYSAYPNPLEKSAIAEKTGFSPSSGGFSNNLGALRSTGMIEYPAAGQVKISSWVMLDE